MQNKLMETIKFNKSVCETKLENPDIFPYVDIIEFFKISDQAKTYINNRLLVCQGIDMLKNVVLELKTNSLGHTSLFIKGYNPQSVREVSLFVQGLRAGLNFAQ